jgi:hypothetical protein
MHTVLAMWKVGATIFIMTLIWVASNLVSRQNQMWSPLRQIHMPMLKQVNRCPSLPCPTWLPILQLTHLLPHPCLSPCLSHAQVLCPLISQPTPLHLHSHSLCPCISNSVFFVLCPILYNSPFLSFVFSLLYQMISHLSKSNQLIEKKNHSWVTKINLYPQEMPVGKLHFSFHAYDVIQM